MTQFSEAAWQRTAQLRAAIDALPFNTELAAGQWDLLIELSRQGDRVFRSKNRVFLK